MLIGWLKSSSTADLEEVVLLAEEEEVLQAIVDVGLKSPLLRSLLPFYILYVQA